MRYAKTLLSTFAVLLLLAACTTTQAPEGTFDGSPSLDITTLALEASVIDFEGLDEGYVVDAVSAGMGISGTDAGGSVAVNGINPTFGAGTNAAIIFDATCGGAPASCSGGVYAPGEQGSVGPFAPGNGNNDDDLYNPAFGNVLIIAENLVDTEPDGNIDDPDDDDVAGEAFFFDFSGWGGGSVVIGQLSATVLDYLDIDGNEGEDVGARVRIFDAADVQLAEFPILATGDGGQGTATALVNYSGVVKMSVDLQGSGAIDNITIATDIPGGGEGCTPGYWRGHSVYAPGNQQDSWIGTGYGADDSFDAVFGVASSFGGSLYEAVTRGGGGEKALGRHAVAALLNAASSVDYLYSEAEVIALVQEAYASGQFEGIKNLLAYQNELGCPLN